MKINIEQLKQFFGIRVLYEEFSAPIVKKTFVYGLAIGIITHLYMFMNDLPNHDTLVNLFKDMKTTVAYGRWFLFYACMPSGTQVNSIPWVIGLISIVYLSAAAVTVVKIFNIQKKPIAFLISAIMITFPNVATTFAYMYTADGYMMGVLFSALAVYLTQQWKYGFLAGGVCIAFSLGIYQAYLSFSIMLVVILLALSLLKDITPVEFFKGALRYLYMGIIGVSLNLVMLKFFLLYRHSALSSYQGINSMSLRNLLNPQNLINIYADAKNFLFSQPYSVLCVIAFFSVALYVIISRRVYRHLWKLAVILVFILATPLILNITLVVSPEAVIHMLMRQPYSAIYIGALVLSDRYLTTGSLQNLLRYSAVILSFCVCFQYYIISNTAYYSEQLRYDAHYGLTLRMLDRIEQMPGYHSGSKVAFIGKTPTEYYANENDTIEIIAPMTGMAYYDTLFRDWMYKAFISLYHNVKYENLTREDEQDLIDNPELSGMGIFPEASSVQYIDGIIVVKVSESADMMPTI